MYNLFVYGTLLEKDNECHKLLEDMSLKSFNAYMYGKMFSLGRCPAITINQCTSDKIYGKVYVLDEDWILKIIDMYEGYDADLTDNLYIRQYNYVCVDDREMPVLTWVYAMEDVEKYAICQIKSGNWLKWKKGQ